MKCIGWVLAIIWMLTGCTAEPTWETITDDMDQPAIHQERKIVMDTSESLLTMESQWGRIYLYDGFEVCIQIEESGNLGRTLQTVTGFTQDELMMLQTSGGDFRRIDCAWSAMSAEGQVVGRTVLLDDGAHHYCVTLTTRSEMMDQVEETWHQLISTIQIL